MLMVGAVLGAIAYDQISRPYITGTALSRDLQDITRSSTALRLLDGSEIPKLRRQLELQLAFAAAQARVSIERGPKMLQFYVADVRPIDTALAILRAQPLDQEFFSALRLQRVSR